MSTEPSATAAPPTPAVPARRRTALIVSICVGTVVALLIVLLATSPSDPDRDVSSPVVGRPAPTIDATDTAGRPVAIDDYRGKWLLLNFFATWCGPCKVEQPELVALSSSVPIVSVAFDDEPDAVTEFFRANGGSWPVVAEGNARIALDYGVVKLPESYLIDPAGRVVHKFDGGVTAAEVSSLVAGATGSTAAPEPSR